LGFRKVTVPFQFTSEMCCAWEWGFLSLHALNFSFKFIQATAVDNLQGSVSIIFPYTLTICLFWNKKSQDAADFEKKSQDEKTDKIKLKVLKLDAFDNLFPYFGEDGGEIRLSSVIGI